MNELVKSTVRDDYRELVERAFRFSGGSFENKIKIRSSDAMYRAPWMAIAT